MLKWYGDYFADVIMDICGLKNYKINVIYKEAEDDDDEEESTFSIKLHTPYRQITLYIRQGGKSLYEKGDFSTVRLYLLHEAVHLITWKLRDLAHARYIRPDEVEEEIEKIAEKLSFVINNLYKQVK